MQVEMLFDGWSGQDELRGQRRGKFGDGLQSAICVLSRKLGVEVKIYSNGHIWSFDWAFTTQVAKVRNVKCLRVKTDPCAPSQPFDSIKHTKVQISGLPKNAFDETQFLFLCPSVASMSNDHGDILLGKDFAGTIYVREMRVLKKAENMHGLNLQKLDPASRDRINHLQEGQKLLHSFNVWHTEVNGKNQLQRCLT